MRAIVQAGDPLLRARASEVPPAKITSPEMLDLVATMIATMRDAPGVGLAAPQIGVPLRVIVLEDRVEYMQRVDAKKVRELERVPFGPRVYVDRMLTRSFATVEQAQAHCGDRSIADVRRMLGV